ncbi:alpha-(1-_3)-arabinofuranosyltransferase domain-containing protein [Actinoplanes derwentensis]|uniref:Arabinofuranan 3-O-arabinosyltransferase n=1 Tax=Actinoplanes derwentensis TaxID=113562 RepID=A0A1H2BK95_9ACTN|nr:alpha-(1->3)-arabinofuranosyltransferase family protein [Actinoplanes derwentensis]GID88853.1 coagulation factor 5/8 type [Actinoplanes derwentensis]SDT58651.1 arabinofuranan 3-O-arabinosyltransferase [Actinoplanes derwentensis]
MTAAVRERTTTATSVPPFSPSRHMLAIGGALVLVVLAFVQRPGRTTFDTKLDLAEDPIGFMSRALHLWNPWATSGELQQQAYGYLFPMGPFFAAGDLLGVPPWITQRLWCAVLLCAAYYGTLLLARALRVGNDTGRIVGALAYALAPRMLTEIGPLSSEMLPVVFLPWVMLPLVRYRQIGSARRAAALSALAVLFMGGINAAAVVMALVLPGLWLITRRWDRDLAKLMFWWVLCVVGVTLWWIVPLLLFGEYSLPFLDFIESSGTTTAVTSLFQATRGTNQWVGYVVQGDPWWPAGYTLVDSPILMAATALVAAVGLTGLALRGMPERRFLIVAAVTGLTLLTMGYVGTLGSPLAPIVRELLDGVLAPLRNVHKFEPVLRLPVALGVAYAASRSIPWRRWGLRIPAAPLAALLLMVAAAPAGMTLLRPGPGWSEIPSYWRDAASWLTDRDAQARTLVVPGSGFAQNTWGRTVDEPMQTLAGAPWSTRNQIPLGSEGNTRVMDTVEAILAQGRGSPALAEFLARSGYRYLLLRNDLDRFAADAPPIATVRRAISGSPGLSRAAEFGPMTGAGGVARSPVDNDASVASIEIFQVGTEVPQVSATAIAGVPVLSGGPESLLGVLEQGLLDGRQPTVLAGDATGELGLADGESQARGIVTDGLRRRELNIGRVRDNVSQTLTTDEKSRQGRVRDDLIPFAPDGHQTVAEYQGIRSVTASSSVAFADTVGPTDPSGLPFAALDGDTGTAWRSDPLQTGEGQRIDVELGTAKRVTAITVDFAADVRFAAAVSLVRITTDQGIVDRTVPSTTGPHTLSTLPGLTTAVRVTVLALRQGFTGAIALRELGIPGLAAERGLRAPADQTAGTAPVYSFTRPAQERGSCFPAASATGTEIRCDQFLARRGEEPLGIDRYFTTPVDADYELRLTAQARPNGTIPLARPVAATASSVLTGDLTVGAHAAVDGDPGTAWLAEPTDDDPALTLSWTGKRRIDRVRLVVPAIPAAAVPSQVVIRANGRETPAKVGADGLVTFPAVVTDRLTIAVDVFSAERVVADDRGRGWSAPAGIAEVEVPALARVLTPATDRTPLAVPCGTGPAVEIGGVTYPTSVTGTLGDIRANRSLKMTVCDDFAGESVQLKAGDQHLRTIPSAAFVVNSAALVPAGGVAAVTGREVAVGDWRATERTVTVAAGVASLLVVTENHNAGWAATLNGATLRPVRVDGWQQAFVVPAGDGGIVTLRFTPDEPYRTGLAAGAGCVLLILILALLPVRRRAVVVARPLARVFTVVPGGSGWMVVPLLALAVVLGGPAAAVLLLGALIVRQVRPGWLPGLAFASAVTAVGVAVSGRLLGHGQEWAYGAGVQLLMLAAVCAVAAAAAPSSGRPEKEISVSDQPVSSYRATLGRSVRLFRTFLVEQSDPDRFYSMLATDSVDQLGAYVDLGGARVLDVGGGPGYFASEFEKVGASYIGLDPGVGDFAEAGAKVNGMVSGSGTALPIHTGALDVTYSSNVLEHVSDPEAMLDEMVRVTRPGGTIFVSYTPWWSPHGGHETGPFRHWFGGHRARARFLRVHGREPKNRFMETLFPVSAARMMRWTRTARRTGTVTVVDVIPRYHPWWAQWVASVPVLREVLTWNFTVVLRREGQEDVSRVSLPDVTQ